MRSGINVFCSLWHVGDDQSLLVLFLDKKSYWFHNQKTDFWGSGGKNFGTPSPACPLIKLREGGGHTFFFHCSVLYAEPIEGAQ